jgi:hypothetical protein
MRQLVIGITAAVTLLLGGILAWNAEATTLTGATTVHPGTNFSLVEKAGCWFPGNCKIGQTQICDRRGRCRCTPCPGWYPWR